MLGKVLWRRKWILISIPVLAAAAAFFFTMDDVEMYKASSQISTGFTQNYEVSLSDEKFNIRDADVKFSNLLSSMNSALPVNLVIFRLLLHDLESETPFRIPANFQPSAEEVETVKAFLKKKLADLSALSTSDTEYVTTREFLYAYGYAYPQVRDNIQIFRVQNTDNVQIDFLSDNPKISALGANAFADEFIRYYNAVKSERTGQSVEFLEELMNQKKAAYDEKTETQKVFKESNGLVDINRDSEAKMAQLQEFERLRDETRSKIQKLELTIQRLNEDIRAAGRTTEPTVNNQKIIELRNRIAKMNERYITSGSSNRKLLDSLDAMREQLSVEMEQSRSQIATPSTPQVNVADLKSKLKDAEIDLKVERSSLQQTENKIANLRYTVSGFANKEAALEAIQKEVELAQKEYQQAVNKYNEAQNRMISTTTLRKVMDASPPPFPVNSKKYLIIAAAAFSSFAICLFAVLGLELIDMSVKTAEKFKRIVNLPVAGILNKVDSKNFNIRFYFNQTTKDEETEMFKSLLRKLRHEVENTASKVILFTSPKRKDGKTFVIFSLAYVLSLINKRVLIIDTNFKKNSLSQMLVKPNSEIKVLEGKRVNLLIGSGKGSRDAESEPESESTYELINPTKYKNIFIIGNAGSGVDSPAEILSGRDFGNLIDVLKESFDYILMEGAALNQFSDTKELVTYADSVFAVFSADASIKQLDRESINYFKSLGRKYAGSVLNRVSTRDLKL